MGLAFPGLTAGTDANIAAEAVREAWSEVLLRDEGLGTPPGWAADIRPSP